MTAQSTKVISTTFKGTKIFRLTHISYPVSISIVLEQHIAKYQTVISSLDIDIKEIKDKIFPVTLLFRLIHFKQQKLKWDDSKINRL